MFDLAAALKAAKSGDTITIPPGDYGDVLIRRVSGLTLKAAGARFRTLVLSEVTGLALLGVAIAFTPDAKSVSSTSALRITLSQGVVIDGGLLTGGLAIAGLPQDTPVSVSRSAAGDAIIGLPIGRGVTIENSTDVTLRGVDVSRFHKAVVLSNVSGLRILRNELHDVRTSPIVGGNVSHALIEDNHLHTARPWNYGGKGDHGDFIHLWTVAGKQTGPSDDIVIRSNLIDQGQGDPILGIYLDDKGNGLGFTGVVIEDNTILNGNAQGIALERVQGTVRRNVLAQTSGTPKQGPSLLLREACDVVVEANDMPDTYGTVAKAAAGGVYCENVARPIAIASASDLAAMRGAWAARFEAPVAAEPEAPPRDELRERLAMRTGVKLEPLKTKGRIILDFKKPAEAEAALAAVLAIS